MTVNGLNDSEWIKNEACGLNYSESFDSKKFSVSDGFEIFWRSLICINLEIQNKINKSKK